MVNQSKSALTDCNHGCGQRAYTIMTPLTTTIPRHLLHYTTYISTSSVATIRITTFNMVGRITDTIKNDHRTIEASYTRLLDASQKDERVRFKNLFAWELSRNLVGKELVVYPALEKRLGEGGSLANRARNENHSVRRTHPLIHKCTNAEQRSRKI